MLAALPVVFRNEDQSALDRYLTIDASDKCDCKPDIVDINGLGQALAGRVASKADGDRPSLPLVDQIADEDICLLPGGNAPMPRRSP